MSLEAEWEGRCHECLEEWKVGDEITTNAYDEWCHVACVRGDHKPVSPDIDLAVKLSICPDCGYAAGRHARMCSA